MMRKVLLPLFLLLSLTLATQAWGVVNYVAVDLGISGYKGIDINASGQIVGNNGYACLFWDNGEKTVFVGSEAGGFAWTHAKQLNDSGQMLYTRTTSVGGTTYSESFVWQKGESRVLIQAAGYRDPMGWGINNLGQVAANIGMDNDSLWHAGIWQGGVWQPLAFRPGCHNQGRAINNQGVVAGEAGSQAVKWENGEMIDLGVEGTVASINNAGQIVGSHNGQGYLWQNGSHVDLGFLSGGNYFSSEAKDINSLGQIVGNSTRHVAGQSDISSGFLWDNGIMYDLNSLTTRPSYMDIRGVSAINDSGQIVGYYSDTRTGTVGAVLLNPVVPEPSSLFALTCGLTGIGGMFLRRR